MKSKRETAAIKVVDVINKCFTKEQIAVAKKVVEQFEKLYDDSLPLMRWVLAKEFEIAHGNRK